jgi:hypothetical protein
VRVSRAKHFFFLLAAQPHAAAHGGRAVGVGAADRRLVLRAWELETSRESAEGGTRV